MAKVQLAKGDTQKADQACSKALNICETTLGKDHPHVATCLVTMSRVRRVEGKLEEAEALSGRALQIREKYLVATHPRIAECVGELAKIRQENGKNEMAATSYERAISIYDKTFPGRSHPGMVTILADYAILLRNEGKTDRAAELERQARSIRSRIQSDGAASPVGEDRHDPEASLSDRKEDPGRSDRILVRPAIRNYRRTAIEHATITT